MKRIRIWAVALPLLLITGLLLAMDLAFDPWLGPTRALAVVWLLSMVGIVIFTVAIFRRLDQSQRELDRALSLERHESAQLEALSEATLLLNSELALNTVLQNVVELAKNVLDADYGALAVMGERGTIQQFLTAGISDEVRAQLGPAPQGHGLLGVVIEDRRSLLVDDIGAHAKSAGFPPGHPPMQTLVAVPVVYGEEAIGSLYVTNAPSGRTFKDSDRRILERFAAQAAVAIVNARLYGEAQRVSTLEERERIAMDLHDGVIQSIYGTSLALQALRQRVTVDPEAVATELDGIVGRLDAVAREVRAYVYDLREIHVKEDSFVRAMQGLVDSTRAAGGPDIRLRVSGEFGGVSQHIQSELWHVAHEALSNAVRHGQPSRVDVILAREGDDHLSLAIQDDGVGFDTSSKSGHAHQGLRNMRQRITQVGGTMVVVSSPGHGTTVAIEVPILEGEE